MNIRRFRNGDESALFCVFYSAVHDTASQDYTPEQVDAWAPADIDPELWAGHMRALLPFVVEHEEEIVGYADIQPNGYIDHFFISGPYARQGVGTLLMKHIQKEAQLLGIAEMTSDVSKTAEPFFLRHGFQVVKRGFPIRRGVTLQNALMRKKLAQCKID
ncbi:GNAT family N-acetyltransferase [Comamonas avium]|jgi:putative acetyltransferase|uniref:GNAT family N-acetyltransferase n=1 Tax=Comamonas avium TaxID=2762231 RepID=A0ABR8S6N0_9BURK|nr:GNAT family N-acetyltransferase [Comamonas avium]MBD7959128.1 GNAT family N-acetyltransferase [Comamonas avium]